MAKILIADDEREVVELLKFLLTKDGNDVMGVYDGMEAMDTLGMDIGQVRKFDPGLVILDIMMPKADGYTVQTKMAQNKATKDIPVIMLTAKGQMKELFAMASNVVAYIEKPFDPEVLRNRIKDILKQRNIQ